MNEPDQQTTLILKRTVGCWIPEDASILLSVDYINKARIDKFEITEWSETGSHDGKFLHVTITELGTGTFMNYHVFTATDLSIQEFYLSSDNPLQELSSTARFQNEDLTFILRRTIQDD